MSLCISRGNWSCSIETRGPVPLRFTQRHEKSFQNEPVA
jgi:hypothetical protein